METLARLQYPPTGAWATHGGLGDDVPSAHGVHTMESTPLLAHLSRLGLNARRSELLAIAAASVHMHFTPRSIEDIPLGASRAAGPPDLPRDKPWPTRDGHPLDFLLQVCLSDLAGLEGAGELPAAGRLWGYGCQDADVSRSLPASVRETGPWRLLAQLDHDPAGPGWMWGDGGRLFFLIRPDDLAQRNFTKVRGVLASG